MLEDFRDVMIIISCFLVIGATLLFSILIVVVFRKISPTINTAHNVVSDLKDVSQIVSGRLTKPAMKGAVFVAGLRGAIRTISKHAHRKEKDDVGGK